MITSAIQGFKLDVDRGPNWLFIKLRPQRHFAQDIPHVADELWGIASRHFIYRVVLELDELRQLPVDLVDQLVILQERLAQCDGSLRVCGLPADCARKLRENQLDAALPNYATRQAALLGGDATALHEKLREVLAATTVSDDQIEMTTAWARQQPSRQ